MQRSFGAAAMRRALSVTLAAAAVIAAVHQGAAAVSSTNSMAQRKSVAITVYNDFAVIRDERTVDLSAGMNRIAFTDVTPQIQQQTAFFANVSSAHPVWVEEQYYDPTDSTVILAGSLFRNAVNHHVLVISVNPTTGQEIRREQAILVSTDGPILRFADRVENQLPPNSRIAYLTLPKVSGTKPALVASLGSTTANRPNLALYYATGGFSWTTDYLARLNAGNDHMDLDAIASVMNQSGLAFDNATLSFVSGTVHREQIYAPEARTLGHVTTTDAYAVNSASDRAARQALLDYYLYTVPHPVSLDSNQTKQISLFSAESVLSPWSTR